MPRNQPKGTSLSTEESPSLFGRSLQSANKPNKDPRFEIYCDTYNSRLVTLVRNPETGGYQLSNNSNVSIDDDILYDSETGSNNTAGRELGDIQSVADTSNNPLDVSTLLWSPRELQTSSVETVEAHLCGCSPIPGTYCPLNARICRVYLANTFRPEQWIDCAGEDQDFWVRYVFPLLMFMFIFFSFLFFCSPKGRYARGYTWRVVRCWDEDRYQQALLDELDRIARRSRTRRAYRHAHRIHESSSGSGILGRQPADNVIVVTEGALGVAQRRVAVLKKKKYQGACEDPNSVHGDEEGEQCAICLHQFVEGDVVGDLVCQHDFHVHCLKSWIKRKNHCPLCKATDVATARNEDLQEGGNVPEDGALAPTGSFATEEGSTSAASSSPEVELTER